MTESTKRYEKSPEAVAAISRRQQQRACLNAAVERCGSATQTEPSIFAKAPGEALNDIDHPYWNQVRKDITRDGMIFMLSCGDTVLYKGEPFGEAHHWTERGVSVRLYGIHRLTECDPANDTLVGLVVTHVELTPVHFLSGLFTVLGK